MIKVLFICHGTPVFTINHTFANLGNTGHNMAQTLVITTVSTTKAHGGRARVAGEIGHIP